MTNTKFRKRALLSSVAMLLVALVALGSATFAWFNTQNSAKAEQIKALTTKGSDITLSETGGTTASSWTHSLEFKNYTLHNTDQLAPVTTKDFQTWYYINAKDFNTGYAEAAAYTNSTTKTDKAYVKHSYLYVKSTKAQNVTITPDVTSSNPGFIRMAFVPITTSATPTSHNAVTKTYATGANLKNIIWCNGALNDRANSNWSAANQTDEVDAAFTSSNATINTTMTASLTFAVTADDIYGFEVFVWEEGTDFDCKDDNAASDVTIKFNVTGDYTESTP